jgi:G:T-mismatch repair DNA endonuclease (very short patch repair protein)
MRLTPPTPTRSRIMAAIRDLRAAGWRVIVVWECQLDAGRGTAAQRASRLDRFARTLVHRVVR